MAESNDIQALSLISSEIDESQIKVILSSQCIKAQAFLVDKIRKQLERQREEYKDISNNNKKLESDIRNAEEELKSLVTAVETVKSANVELKKELLLAQERKLELIEHFRNGEIKYEAVWQQCKSRFESLPFIQNWMQLNNTMQGLKESVISMENKISGLNNEFEIKTIDISIINRKRIVELAKYIVHEIPSSVKVFREKSKDIASLKKEIADLSKHLKATAIPVVPTSTPSVDKDLKDDAKNQFDDNLPNLYKNVHNDAMMLPKLHLKNIDLEAFSEKLDQIKKTGHVTMSPQKRNIESENRQSQNNLFKKPRLESMFTEHMFTKQSNSTPYNNLTLNEKGNKDQDYSKKKLINILDDIKLDSNDAMKLISSVNPSSLKDVEIIESRKTEADLQPRNDNNKEINESTNSEVIETPNLNASDKILPPSQFLDNTQEISSFKKLSQELSQKSTLGQASEKSTNENENNLTFGSQLDISSVNDESFVNMKNMLLKKNNLDLSPQFVYAKNNLLQKNSDDYVASKYFEKEMKSSVKSSVEIIEVLEEKTPVNTSINEDNANIEMTEDNVVTSSPKKLQPTPIQEKHVSGFLFNHGSCGIPESLNVSINTTGMEDGEGDYPVPIDSSLLLSPKADMTLTVNDGNDNTVQSQEVPNFLSGLRKTGLSFFGRMCTDSTGDNNVQNQATSFSFKFGGDTEKKNRGGLFNMFH